MKIIEVERFDELQQACFGVHFEVHFGVQYGSIKENTSPYRV